MYENGAILAPIETRYNGFRFRSRLEARYAVFFTTMELQFQYEPEGFQFEDGTRYLPDFFLPNIEMWAEVKPVEPTTEELAKARMLARASKSPVIFLIGPPDFRLYEIVGWADDVREWVDASVSLDTHRHAKLYADGRLWWDNPPLASCSFSDRYQDAVYDSREARFGA